MYLNAVQTKVFAIVFVFGNFLVVVFVLCTVFDPKSDSVYLNSCVSFPYIHGESAIDCGNEFQSLITLLLDIVYELCDNIIM